MTGDTVRSSRPLPLAAVLLGCALLAGCAGMWASQPDPGRTLAGGAPADLRITFAAGDSAIVLRRAVLAGDSLVGADPAGARRAVALADARRVERWQGAAQRTTGAVILGTLAALAALVALIVVSIPET